MTEWVTYGSVGGAAGNSRSYTELVVGPGPGTWLRHNPAPPPTQVIGLLASELVLDATPLLQTEIREH